jgi:hypothetical protein
VCVCMCVCVSGGGVMCVCVCVCVCEGVFGWRGSGGVMMKTLTNTRKLVRACYCL